MFTWLLFFLYYLPFQIALNIAPTIDLSSARFFIVLFFIVWAFLFISKHKKISFRKGLIINLQSISLFLFIIISLFSLFGADSLFWGVRKIIYFLSIFPLYFLVVNVIETYDQIKKIIKVIFLGGFVIAFIGLVQFVMPFLFSIDKVYSFWAINIVPVFSGFNYGSMILAYPSWLVNISGYTIMRAFSLFSDPHIFSFYLGLVLTVTVMMVWCFSNSMPLRTMWSERAWFFTVLPGLTITIFLICFMALLLSFSRGAYIAIILSFLIISFLLWQFVGDKKKAICLCLILLIFLIPGTPIAQRFYSSFNMNEGSNMGRLEMWQKAGQVGLKNPLLGVGLGNYALSVDSKYDYCNPVTAHNFYLDLLSEMGIMSVLIWIFMIIATVYQLFIQLKNSDYEKQIIIVGLMGSLIYFSIHSFFETAIYSPIISSLLMIILGLSTIIIYDAKNNKT